LALPAVFSRQVVPLMAGNLAGFAADADRGVGVEAFCHKARSKVKVKGQSKFKACSLWPLTFDP
jgi:hypothetical protein